LDRYSILKLHQLHPEWSTAQLGEAAGCHRETARLICLASTREAQDLMAAAGSERLADWEQASRLASARGDHRPAKDWLMHAGTIDPLPESGRGSGPAVVILNAPLPGMPGSAVKILDAGAVSVVVDPQEK
jgi:hypothetical protein